MNKYINGKIVKMTEADIQKKEARANNRPNARKNTSNYETRIKELEDMVAKLLGEQEVAEESVVAEDTTQ